MRFSEPCSVTLDFARTQKPVLVPETRSVASTDEVEGVAPTCGYHTNVNHYQANEISCSRPLFIYQNYSRRLPHPSNIKENDITFFLSMTTEQRYAAFPPFRFFRLPFSSIAAFSLSSSASLTTSRDASTASSKTPRATHAIPPRMKPSMAPKAGGKGKLCHGRSQSRARGMTKSHAVRMVPITGYTVARSRWVLGLLGGRGGVSVHLIAEKRKRTRVRRKDA